MPNTVKIRIEGESGNLQAFDEATRKIDGATHAAREFVETLKMGVGIDLGGRIVEGIAEIPTIIREAIAEGVEFNAELETMRLTLAGMAKQFSEGGIASFNQGLQVSDQLIGKMREKANELGLSFEALLETYKTSAGALFHGGVTDLEKQLDLVVLLSRAMQGMGISGFMATRDIQDILMGMADRTKAGRELGVKDADIEAAKEQGQLYEFLSEKLSGFTEAGNAGTQTLNAELARLHNEIQGIEAEISKPIFEALKEGLAVLNQELQKPEAIESLKHLGFELADIVKSGMALLDWAVRNADTLQTMAHAAGILAVALAAMQIAKLTVELGMWASSLIVTKTAIDAETAALARNTAAQEANAVARAAGGAGLAGRAGMVATGAEVAGGSMGAGGLAAAAGPIAAVVALAAAGVGIGAWRAGIDRAQEKQDLETSRKDLMGGNGLAKMDNLMQQTFAATSGDQEEVRKALEKQIIIEEQGAQLEGLRGDLAKERLFVLEKMLAELPKFVEDNNRQLAQEKALEDAQERREQAMEREAKHAQLMQETKERSEAIGASMIKAGEQSTNVDERLAFLRADAMTQRMKFQQRAFTTSNVDPLTASPAELKLATGESINEEARKEGMQAAERLEEINREISKILDEQGHKLEENMHREAERFLQVDKARKAMQSENEILSATAAGNYAAAAAAERRRQIEEQVAKLVKDGIPEVEARASAERNSALKLEASRAKTLQDLEEEHAITQAKISGETALVDLLMRQREVRQQIEALEKAGLSETEARAKATQAADDRQGVEMSKRREELDKVQADLAVESARTPGQRQRAEIDKLRTDSYYELKGKGLTEEQINDVIGDRIDNYRRANRGRTIGGPTTRSAQDHLGDRMSDADWKNQFTPRGAGAAGSSPLDERPDSAQRSPFDRPLGKTSDQAWNDIFKHGVGPLAPAPASRTADEQFGPPAPKGQVTDKGGGATDALQKGGQQLGDGASKMQGAASAIQAGVQQLTSAAQSLSQLGPTITEAVQNLKQEIDDLKSQIADLQNT